MGKGGAIMIYFDNAATTMRKPDCVIDAVADAMRNFGNSGRGAHEPGTGASAVSSRAAHGRNEAAVNFNGGETGRMSMQALISVVVPVYNSETFLRKTVRCIQEQTDPAFEIILVNDGSLDGSLELCRELEKEDARIRVLTQENKGLSAARNAGVLEAHGEYISFVDSDDLIYPDMIANLRAGMDEMRRRGLRNVQVQIGREEIDENGNALPPAIIAPEEPVLIPPVLFVQSMLLYTGDASFCTKLTPRRILLEHPFEVGALCEDFSLETHLVDILDGVYNLPQIGYRVVHRLGSLTRRRSVNQFSRAYIAIIEASDYVEKELVPRYPKLEVAARRFGLYERLDYMLHVPIAQMNRKNEFYMQVLHYLRENKTAIRENPYLAHRDRIYLTILSAAPVLVRRVHRVSMRLRGIKMK